MATQFDAVYGSFLSKVSDFDLADMTEANAKIVMHDLLNHAIALFGESCKKDLLDVTETGWIADLSNFEIDILSELMVEAWFKPRVANIELLRSKLSTKDFTVFSPANQLKENREAYEQAHKRSRSMINEYSYRENNIGELL